MTPPDDAPLFTPYEALDVTLTEEDLDHLDRTFAPGAITGDRYPPQMGHLAAK